MSKFYFILFVCLFTSCTNSEYEVDTTIPDCIQEILNDSIASADIKTIRVQENDGELNYWLNTDFTHFDGLEFVLNVNCDTVCIFCGECYPPSCAYDYEFEWKVIWEQ